MVAEVDPGRNLQNILLMYTKRVVCTGHVGRQAFSYSGFMQGQRLHWQ